MISTNRGASLGERAGGQRPMKNIERKLRFAGKSVLRVVAMALMVIPALAVILLHGSAAARQQGADAAKPVAAATKAAPAATEPPIVSAHVDLTKTPTLYI